MVHFWFLWGHKPWSPWWMQCVCLTHPPMPLSSFCGLSSCLYYVSLLLASHFAEDGFTWVCCHVQAFRLMRTILLLSTEITRISSTFNRTELSCKTWPNATWLIQLQFEPWTQLEVWGRISGWYLDARKTLMAVANSFRKCLCSQGLPILLLSWNSI